MSQKKTFIALYVAILFLVLFSLTSISAASAAEQYQLTAPYSPVTVASCGQATEIVTVSNTGNFAAPVQLSFVDSAVAKFSQIQPSSFFLAPGDQKTVTLFVNAPCKKDGTFDYSLKLVGSSISQIFARSLIISRVNNIDLIATQGTTLTSCPCLPQSIPFTLTNSGSWPESYAITVSGAGQDGQNVLLPQSFVLLNPGQTYSGTAFASYSCQTYGTQNFKLNVHATNSGFDAALPFTYEIAACYDYSLGTAPYVSVCEQDSLESGLIVNNTAAYTNTFNVGASLPSFAGLGGNQVTLQSKQVGIVPIEIAPGRGDAGNYSYAITTKNVLGNFVASATGILNVQRCYVYGISAQNDQTKFDLCAPGDSFPFTISNLGERAQQIHVNSTDARFTIKPNIFNLSAGESQLVTISVPSLGVDKKLSFDIQVWSTNNPQVIQAKHIIIQPHDLTACYGVEVSPVVFTLNNSPTNLSLKIKNVGMRDTNYTLSLVASPWAHLIQTSVFIPAKESRYIGITASAPIFVENTTYAANITLSTPYSQQTVKLLFKLNSQTVQWLFWALGIIVLVLLALLIILLAARSTKKTRIAQSAPKINEAQEQARKLAAQKAELRLIARRESSLRAKELRLAKKENEVKSQLNQITRLLSEKPTPAIQKEKNVSSWLLLLFIILIVAILLAALLGLIIKNSEVTRIITQTNQTNVSQISTTTNQSTTQTNTTQTHINQTNNTTSQNISIIQGGEGTNVTSVNISSNLSSNATNLNLSNISTNVSANVSANVSSNQTTASQTPSQSMSFWQWLTQSLSWLWKSPSSRMTNVTNSTNLTLNATTNNTIVPITNITNITNATNATTSANASNITHISNATNVSSSNTNQSTQPTQRDLDLSAAREFLAQNSKSPRVFVIPQNQSGILNLSQFFIDPDNLSLNFEFESVNASQLTAFINGDQLVLQPRKNFVGIQTFRITATNAANLSTTSPIFTLVVLDTLPPQMLSQSIQLGLLILLIIIAIIVYFDIRLISKQYEHARAIQKQDEPKKKK